MRLSLQKRNVKNKLVSGIFDTTSIIAISHTLSNKKVLPAFYCRLGLLFALWCLALNNKGVAVFFHRDKALERLVLSFVQECLDGQASILIIQPFGAHSDNEVV